MSYTLSHPPIPDQPVIPDAPSPGKPEDVPDIGTPEPQPADEPSPNPAPPTQPSGFSS